MAQVLSWGRYFRHAQSLVELHDPARQISSDTSSTVLPLGRANSYGDVCLNDGGTLLSCAKLNKIIAFDPEAGTITVEPGVTMEQILAYAVPHGWMPMVLPGTRTVTVGGAIANDIHGKNHHRAGTFGRHVISLTLLRSDAKILECSTSENPTLFAATIGGLGLTGLVVKAQLQLQKIASSVIAAEAVKFGSLDEYFAVDNESAMSHAYSVTWLDPVRCRGIFFRGNIAEDATELSYSMIKEKISLPRFTPRLFNRVSDFCFRQLQFHKQIKTHKSSRQTLGEFFFPLDTVRGLNHAYGPHGMHQVQLVLPLSARHETAALLKAATTDGIRPALTGLKSFANLPSPGILSFPMEGLSIAMDFPHRGAETVTKILRLIHMATALGGRVYPAKDSCQTPTDFRLGYPQWQEFAKAIDPKFSSSFWRRVHDNSL